MANTTETLGALARAKAQPQKDDPPNERGEPSGPMRELAASLGVEATALRAEYGTYAPAHAAVAGPACPSDLQWTMLRQSNALPDDVTLRAHLTSCIRCAPRAIYVLGPDRWRLLNQEGFAPELLCLDSETIALSIDSPDRLSPVAATHLEHCGTCRADRDDTSDAPLTRDVANRLISRAFFREWQGARVK